jgi:hypothetical protein
MQAPVSNSGNPLLGFLGLICMIAAVVDAIYWKRGGQRTPKKTVRQYQIFLIFLALLAIVMDVFFGPGAAGTLTGMFSNFVFIGWEWERYKIRRDNPIPSKATS